MPAAIDVSIIIVSYNARQELSRCLDSLTKAPPTARHEIIVVDNASSDGSAEEAGRLEGVRIIALDRNIGFGGANNVGIKASSGRVLLLLNSDTLTPPGAVDQLIALLERDSGIGVVGPRLVDAEGRVELSFGRMIGPLNELRQKWLGRAYARGAAWATRLVERAAGREHSPDWVSGACMVMRRTDALAVGGFDERFFMYTEDVDLCARFRAEGRRVLFTPAIEIVHLRGRSAATAPLATARAYRQSHLAFYEKHHPAWAPFLRSYLRLRGLP